MATACAGDGTSESEPPDASGAPSTSAVNESAGAEAQYMLVEDPEWKLREAIDYRAGLGPLGDQDPDLDWYAEYDGARVDHGDGSYTIPAITVFGHTAGLEERRDQLAGFEFRSDAVSGRRALVAAAAGGNPAVVVVEVTSEYTVTLLTYDEGVNVRDIAFRLTAADEQQWAAAGGTMLDCVPFQPGCAPDS